MIPPREGVDRAEKSRPERWSGTSKGGPVGGAGRREETERAWSLETH